MFKFPFTDDPGQAKFQVRAIGKITRSEAARMIRDLAMMLADDPETIDLQLEVETGYNLESGKRHVTGRVRVGPMTGSSSFVVSGGGMYVKEGEAES